MKANKILPLICLILASCAPVKETVYVDRNVYKNTHTRDSVYWMIRDSVHIQTKNDTVFVERWQTSWRDREIVRDSIIHIENTTFIEKEKDLSLKQKIKLKIADYSIIFCIFALLITVLRFLIKIK